MEVNIKSGGVPLLLFRGCGVRRAFFFIFFIFYLHISKKMYTFAANFEKEAIMTALELNADIYRSLGILSEDESMLKRAAKYLKRLANELTDDPTCMSKEEFLARVDEAKKGPTFRMLPDETLDEMLTRLGYV